MTFPILWEGKVLFRYGYPAMSRSCCCCKIYCCGSCYFPLSTAITNFWSRTTGSTTGEVIEQVQSGPSNHRTIDLSVEPKFCVNKASNCGWTLPTVYSRNDFDPTQVGKPSFIIGISHTDTYDYTEWEAAVNGVPYFTNGVTLYPLVGCSGDFSWDEIMTAPGGGSSHNEGGFTVTDGKKWPAGFSCVGSTLMYDGREAELSDLPAGFIEE